MRKRDVTGSYRDWSKENLEDFHSQPLVPVSEVWKTLLSERGSIK